MWRLTWVGAVMLSAAYGGIAAGAEPQPATVNLNSTLGQVRGVVLQTGGSTRWSLLTDGDDNLSLYAYADDGSYRNKPIFLDRKERRVSIDGLAVLSNITAPVDGGPTGQIFSSHNTSSGARLANGGIGTTFQYFSSAHARAFDVAQELTASFNPAAFRDGTQSGLGSQSGPGNYGQFLYVLSPNDDAHNWGTAVAEWNIVNRGPDLGWFRDRNHQPNTGGLLLVPEVSVAHDAGGGEGRHAGYAFSVARSSSTNSAGDSAKFYNGYLCEPNSLVGVGQAAHGAAESYCAYMTGDVTGVAAKMPFAPIGLDGRWEHGITSVRASFTDAMVLQAATGQAVGWTDGTGTARITGYGTGGNVGMVLTPAGGGEVRVGGTLQVDGSAMFHGTVSSDTAKVGVTTVDVLPRCNPAAEGMRAGVSDALHPSFLEPLAGGGSVHSPAYCNGRDWVAG